MGGPVNNNLNSTPVRTKIERWEVIAGRAGKVVRSGGKVVQKRKNISEGRKEGRNKAGKGAPTSSPTNQQKISKYVIKYEKARESSCTQGRMGSPDSLGEGKGEEGSNPKLNTTGGSSRGPPLGSRNQAMPETTSNGKAVHQEGGTDVQHMGGTTSKDPPYRELTRSLPREGRDRGAEGRSKKMAKAMEEWLRMGKAGKYEARGAKEGRCQKEQIEKKEENER